MRNSRDRDTESPRTSIDPAEARIEKLLEGLDPVELPPFYRAQLRARVRAAAARPLWVERLRAPQFAWSVAAACVVALLVIVLSTRPEAPGPAGLPHEFELAGATIDPVMPADNEIVGAGDVEIVAAIYPPLASGGIVRLLVDDRDVTGLADVTADYVMYSPEERFEEGEHIVTIQITDGAGRELRNVSWLFYALNGGRPSDDERV